MADHLSEEAVFRVAYAIESPDIREEYLRQVSLGNATLYNRVIALLQVHQSKPEFLESPPPGVAATMDRLPVGQHAGPRIGPYTLLEKIGEGGMGVVYVAEQTDPVWRKVALKIIKPGMDSREVVARFEAERQALALMDHPNIARVLDAGTIEAEGGRLEAGGGRPEAEGGRPEAGDKAVHPSSSSADLNAPLSDAPPHSSSLRSPASGIRPFFVMELVRGIPITEFCDQQKLATRGRLELFVTVCQAVQHAHQKGVIHRDLKPSNLLVEVHDVTPVPKIIDFGVAKAMGQQRTNESLHTRFDQMVGTPLYMSPEQAGQSGLDVDTRSDIYSLGVVLYELLTGHTPFYREALCSVGYEELQRIIREVDPPRPSARISTLEAADLSTISDCRQIEPHKLSQQLRGELDWIVMKALEKDRDRRYQSSSALAEDIERYLRDEPVQAGPPSTAYRLRKFARRNKRALFTASAAALVILLGVGALGGSIGYVVRERAVRLTETERAVESALDEANALEQQAKWSAALEAAKRAQVVAVSQSGSDELRARVEQRIKDLTMVLRVEEIRLETSAVKDEKFDSSLGNRLYAQAFCDYGIDVDALPPEEVAQRMPDGPVRIALAAALDDWARLRRATAAAPEDKGDWKRLVAAAQATDVDPWRSRLRDAWIKNDKKAAQELVASVPRESLHPSQVLLAQPLLTRDEFIALLRDAQSRHPADFWLNHTLALALMEKEPFDAGEALGFYRVALALRPESPGVLLNLANALSQLDRYDEAIAAYEQAIRIKPDYATAYGSLGAEFVRQGAWDKAIDTLRKAVALNPRNSAAYFQLGTSLCNQGTSDNDAEAALREAIRLNPRFTQTHSNLGTVLARKGDLEGAEKSHRMAVWLDPNHAEAYNELGAFLCDRRQDYGGAIAAFRRAIELGLMDGRAHSNLGHALLGKGDVDEAISFFRQATELEPDDFKTHLDLCSALMRKQSWDDAIASAREAIRCNPDLAEAHCNLGRALQQKGQLHEALDALQCGHELGIQDPNWQYPSARWVQECQELLKEAESKKSQENGPVRSTAPTTALTGPDIPRAIWSARSGRWPSALFLHDSQTDPLQKDHTMSQTHLSRTTSRRDLETSQRRSRPNSHTRLCRRPLQLERLEERQLLATITGQVFNDLNADGLKDGGESGQSGWTIYLDADGNGQFDTGETSTTTAADGSYSFNGLAPGTYTVAEVQQPGWLQTSPSGPAPAIERVSLAADGTQGNGSSDYTALSADGRYVAFYSSASNLVPGDTNGVVDAFVYDRQTDTIERVSIAANGTQGNGTSGSNCFPDISADGRYVAFNSSASNLVPGDTNGQMDAFVYDRQSDTIERVSLGSDGTQGNGSSYSVSLSDDGRYVAFCSYASNLVPGDTNGVREPFVYDRQTDTIERIAVASDDTQGNGMSINASISADGRYVAFPSYASNLVPDDTNGVGDAFVYDRQTDMIERVSLATDGTQGNGLSDRPSISDDGCYVTFSSYASNLVAGDTNGQCDIFVYDRQTDMVEQVSVASDGTQGNDYSVYPSMSADGRYVAFNSAASNLVPDDANGVGDAFVYDRQTDTIQRVSVAADGTPGNSGSGRPTLSADGRYAAFMSGASNLVPGDTNGVGDAFVTANPFAWASGSHVVTLAEGQDVSGIDFGNTSPTKFYVVNDATQNLTYEYTASGQLNESYSLNSGNTAPRGAASTIAGDKTWVVDVNRKVYVYDAGGGLLGSWTAGTLASNAAVEGIATNGTDVWIVDAKSDKVFKYTGAATRTSGTQYAASSFNLNSGNTSPKDIVTDGTSLWVINDSSTDKVFKYSIAGSLKGSWTISSGGGSPTGITLDPGYVSNLWIVDSATDRVYQYDAAASRTSGSQEPSVSFALAAGNTNPQGIADPPVPCSELVVSSIVVDGGDAPIRDAAANSAGVSSLAMPDTRFVHRLLDRQRSAPASHSVDQFMMRLESELGTVRSATSAAWMTAPHARRFTLQRSDLSCDPLRDDLDATIDSIADDLVALSARHV